ncbi:MAG TPA: lysophospholipid acyltransferase family protein [Noviherbaspirillum sp.]|nr:lysophospholipid acyltransferase family protein [Noviherbaspirillum sp.]
MFALLLLSFGVLAILAGRVDRARRLARFFARQMLRLGGLPVSVSGLDRLPPAPHVLLANHTSFLDPIVLVACLPPVPGYTYTTRRQHLLQVLLWPFLHSLHTLILKPHTSGESGDHHHSVNVERMEAVLRRGDNLMVFPEGAFRPEPGLAPFHSGAFVAAAQAQVPIVVVGLRGARDALRLGTWRPRRASLALEIGTVLQPSGSDPRAIHALMDEAYAAMVPLTGEPPRAGVHGWAHADDAHRRA